MTANIHPGRPVLNQLLAVPEGCRERGILMTAPNVLAILAGRKTETRRIVKPQPVDHEHVGMVNAAYCGHPEKWLIDGDVWRQTEFGGPQEWQCPYGVPCDRLWVRETFYCDHCEYQGALAGLPALTGDDLQKYMYYNADGPVRDQIPECEGIPKLKPGIFMPRWASRITLGIVSIGVERLQDISEEDCQAEGVEHDAIVGYYCEEPTHQHEGVHCCNWRFGYKMLWESINGPGSWAKNPWVWVIKFKRIPSRDCGTGPIKS